ncbi:MAG: hypothetical protein NC204_04755 [Candidatus Amulumruptor caecigallinarius]|nr:hypothetical protein [Candidatus Amulumruptor caecigallinarius]
MADNNIATAIAKVRNLIDSNHIYQSLNKLQGVTRELNMHIESDELQRIRDTYRYMLHYMVEGTPDAGRNDMLNSIRESLRTICDKAIRINNSHDGNDYYSSQLRFNNLRNESIQQLLNRYTKVSNELVLAEAAGNDDISLRKQREDLLERIFSNIFTSFGEAANYNLIKEKIQSGFAGDQLTAQAISALTLSLMTYYDSAKLETLMDIYEDANDGDDATVARAIAGILFTLEKYPDRIRQNPRLKARLSLWNDSLLTYRRLRETIRVIIGTRDTERVVSKMKDEVIPELIKLRPEIMKSMKNIPKDIDPADIEAAIMENNPEWEEMLKESGLAKKMRELSEMQNEGADLMMVTFANLKQFPFFSTPANWFLPFDESHSSLNIPDKMKGLFSLLGESGSIICDGDLYSLAFAIERMPDAQREMVSAQFSANIPQMKEMMRENAEESSSPGFDREILRVVRELYRFYKLFRNKEKLDDPFKNPFEFTELPVIGDICAEDDVVKLVGEFYFKRGYFKESLPLLKRLADTEHADASLWEKIGFCYQNTGNFTKALEAYDRASLYKKPGSWRLKKLAVVNRMLGNFSAAAENYENLLEIEPDNVTTLLNCGNACLIEGRTDDALRHFYHAKYLLPDNVKVQRALAWAELLNHNFGKSSEAYDSIIATDPQTSDYLNAGHAKLLAGNLKDAIAFYKKASSGNPEEFEPAFRADLPALQKVGLDNDIAELIPDAVRLMADN